MRSALLGTKVFCDVGLFALAEKSAKQRLAIDVRRANLCFDDPLDVSMQTSASFGHLGVAPGQILHCTQFDLSGAFYQFEMPEPLRPFFCLPPVNCREVGVFKIGGRSLPAGAKIYPQFGAMAMGWTHALAWRQSIFSRLARETAPLSPLLSDYAPTPDPSGPPVLSVYVDNLAVIGTDETAVREAGTAILAATHAVGLKTHEWEEDSGSFSLLGLTSRTVFCRRRCPGSRRSGRASVTC